MAAMLWTIVANFGNDEPLGRLRRDDRLFSLGLLAFGFAGLLAVPGAILTVAFLRWPRAWLRKSYYTVLFLIVVANLLIFTTEGWRWATLLCWDCGLEVWWTQTIVPASLFIALAPPVKFMLAPHIGPHVDGYVRDAVLRLRRVPESLLSEPPPGTRVPRATSWLAAAPWLFWLAAALMTAADGRDVVSIVIPVGYVAAFVITLIVTPVLGYRVFRDARYLSRTQKAWSLAGLAAGLACYAFVASSLRYIF